MAGFEKKFVWTASRLLPVSMLSTLARWGILPKYAAVQLLRRGADQLSSLMRTLQFHQDILIRPDGSVFVHSDGVLLSAAGTNRYLKVRSDASGNQGAKMAAFLAEKGIAAPRVVLDIGANFGEISLYFSRRFPDARIVSVEASTENLAILRSNIAIQSFDPGNIHVVHAAVSDREGSIQFGMGRGPENSIIVEHQRRGPDNRPMVEKVPTLPLARIFERENIDRVDL